MPFLRLRKRETKCLQTKKKNKNRGKCWHFGSSDYVISRIDRLTWPTVIKPSHLSSKLIVCRRKLKVGICNESEYLLRNTFSQINEKKLNKSNESKMEAISLSKRSPCVQKLLCNRLQKNFYEEKTFPHLLKKFWTLRSSLHQTSRRDIFQKITWQRLKKYSDWRGLW